jgi:hypothetical protein
MPTILMSSPRRPRATPSFSSKLGIAKKEEPWFRRDESGALALILAYLSIMSVNKSQI